MEGQDSNGVCVEDVFADYDKLSDLCENNAEYYKNDTSTVGKKIHCSLLSIIDNLILIRPLAEYYREICPKYDFDENSRGNGYRSYVLVTDAFVRHGVKINKQIFASRNSYFFRRGTALKELEVIDQGIGSLLLILTHLQELITWGEPGSLYPREEHAPEEILYRAHNLNQYCFYGRSLGFQFCESMHTVLKGLGILMASFSEIYYSGGGVFERATSSLWNSSKYLVNPELRAKRIVNISQYASVNFCKQFWFLGENEMMKRLPNLVSASVGVNRIISIPPEPLTIDLVDGTPLQVPIPSAHIGPAPLDVRLMSALKYEGMMGEANSKSLKPPSRGLFFHNHGGGFVAQSSRSHETYLCQWAKSIGVPILSIDYNLAPEAPFPRALEDIFYAYCWALKNAALLGTTAERIVVGGDSAGGTLSLCLTLKCIQMGVRPPDGIFLAYTPVVISFVPSPARLLCLMDPLLPLGFLTGCLRAYACTPEAYAAAVKGFEEKLCRSCSARPGLEESKRSNLNSVNSVVTEIEIDYSAEEMKENDPTEIEHLNGLEHSANVISKTPTKEENDDEIFDKYVAHEANGIVPESVNGIEENVMNGEEKENMENAAMNGNGVANRKTSAVNASAIKSPTKGSLKNLPESASVDEELEEATLPIPVELLKFHVPNDPFLSPFLASDEDLKKFPPSCFLTLHMDPCLDDCVEMAKKLKRLGTDVHLDVLEGLPHGFLNFSLLSKEAYEGSKLCIERIKSLLNLPTDVTEEPQTQST